MNAYARLIQAISILAPLLACTLGASGPQVKLIKVPQDGLQPQVLIDSNGTLHLVYLAGDPKHSDVLYARRPVGQTNFSDPIRINSISGSAIAVGTVRGAQFALGRNGRVHVVWNGSNQASTSPNGSAPMLYSRMNEAGTGFEQQRDLMTATTHLDGGGSVAADPEGRVYVVWHGHKRTGPQEEIDRGVFVAFSNDDGNTFTPERQVNPSDTGACGCCGLKAYADDRGSLAILYRSANVSGNRDSLLLVSTNHGQSFTTTIVGPWHVSTCPMSTFALGSSRNGLFGMWETAGQVYSANLNSGTDGRLNPVPVTGENKKRKHPVFAAPAKRHEPILIAWTEGTGWEKGGTLAWECLDDHGVAISSGRSEGVPVWGSLAAFAEPDGSFTILY
jgi:hypothetical protein